MTVNLNNEVKKKFIGSVNRNLVFGIGQRAARDLKQIALLMLAK